MSACVALLAGLALARVGDRLPLAPSSHPEAILVYAGWSSPSMVERHLLRQAVARVNRSSAPLDRIQLVLLDADRPADAARIAAIGGSGTVPFALLVTPDDEVAERYLGWPGRNPAEIRTELERSLAALSQLGHAPDHLAQRELSPRSDRQYHWVPRHGAGSPLTGLPNQEER